MASERWSLCNGFCNILGVTKEKFLSLSRKIIISYVQKNQTWLPNRGPKWYNIYSH